MRKAAANYKVAVSVQNLLAEKVFDYILRQRIIINFMNIELKKVSFSYRPEIPIIKGADLLIEKSAFAFIIGLNGSGKSTLLKLAGRLLTPSEGEILIGGKNIASYEAKQFARIAAYVPQNYAPAFPFTVYDFVATGRTPYLNFYGVLKPKDKEIINANLRLLEIGSLAEKKITEISGGEFRRVLIARALTQEPQILLLDEPSAFLDIEHQISIFEMLKALHDDKNLTVVTVSHDLNLTGMFATDVVLLENGKTSTHKKEELLTPEKIREHFGVNAEIVKRGENLNVTVVRR